MELHERREIYNGFGDGLARAFELAVTPAVFGAIGWGVDRWLGLSPLFTIVLFLFGVAGTSYMAWFRYEAEMRRVEADKPWARSRAAEGGQVTAAALGLEGPAPEQQLARDLARRAVLVSPVLILVGAFGWGYAGALSAGYGIALVVVNFLLAASLIAWAGRISLGFLMGAVLGGYILRLGLLTAAVLLVRDAGWVEPVPLGLTIVVTHLGLLVWETRYVSASLAFPVLKPRKGALR